jgi:hypothetical protein
MEKRKETRRSKTSKKTKKDWRKNIPIEDVENAIQAISTEERLHGALIADKRNDDLFFIDKSGGTERPKKSVKTLTIDKILTPDSKISLFQSQGPRKKTKGSNKTRSSLAKPTTEGPKNTSSVAKTTFLWNEPKSTPRNNGFATTTIHPGSSYRPVLKDQIEALSLVAKNEKKKQASPPLEENAVKALDDIPQDPEDILYLPLDVPCKPKEPTKRLTKSERNARKKKREADRIIALEKKSRANERRNDSALEKLPILLEEAKKSRTSLSKKSSNNVREKKKVVKRSALSRPPVAPLNQVPTSLRTVSPGSSTSILLDKMSQLKRQGILSKNKKG